MNFLTRIFSREAEEVVETISMADHEAALADMSANHASNMAVERTRWSQAIGIERDTVARLVAKNRELRAELAHWQQYGQLLLQGSRRGDAADDNAGRT